MAVIINNTNDLFFCNRTWYKFDQKRKEFLPIPKELQRPKGENYYHILRSIWKNDGNRETKETIRDTW